ncbi:MAG: aldehyde dehydrogenase (NADP(+)) [Actinomycetes bacterium]
MSTFKSVNPQTGESFGPDFENTSENRVNLVIENSWRSKTAIAGTSPFERAKLLRNIGSELEAVRAQIVAITVQESGLPEARINGELTRTIFQWNHFAAALESGGNIHPIIDKADPEYGMGPRPDIRKQNQALGVVAIFGASNFPLAFSTAGNDAASALAAGNAVVVKGHPSHPQTSQVVAAAIHRALKSAGLSEETFALIQGNNPELTHLVASHPLISAIGFTGSGTVGKLLMTIAASRPKVIPVYAEMGAINPLFITENAMAERIDDLVKGVVDSALLGSGQFCTKPGFVVISSTHAESFITKTEQYLSTLAVAPLLNQGIAQRYTTSISELSKLGEIKVISGIPRSEGFGVTPTFFYAPWATVSKNPELLEEHFGPTTVIVSAAESDFVAIATSLEGQLTATIHGTDSDDIKALQAKLSEIAGRVIWNGFPTGVSVTTAMQHGGPFPASSIDSTSIGSDAMLRFMRPVSYQNAREIDLPPALQDTNPWNLERLINGVRTK